MDRELRHERSGMVLTPWGRSVRPGRATAAVEGKQDFQLTVFLIKDRLRPFLQSPVFGSTSNGSHMAALPFILRQAQHERGLVAVTW